MKNLLEECTLTIVSNDGDTALADVFVQGEKVDTASFEREEESVRDFCKSFPVGRVTQGKRAVSTEQEFERQAEKTKPSYGSENKEVNLDPKGSKSSPLESMVSAGDRVCFEQGRTLAKSFLGLGYEGKPNRRNEHRERYFGFTQQLGKDEQD